MKHVNVSKNRLPFAVVLDGDSSQAAMMTLKPGESSSDEVVDEHPRAEQWLLVLAGSGVARTKRRSIRIGEGSLVLVEKDEPHQVRNTGDVPLVTVNFYAPAAYSHAGQVKRSVRRKKGR